MNPELAGKSCVPCQGGTPPLAGEALRALSKELGGGWDVVEEHHIEKTFRFKTYPECIGFTNAVAELAEAENHHPDIYLAWGKVKVTLWTHKVKGLSENDFILAAKIDRIHET